MWTAVCKAVHLNQCPNPQIPRLVNLKSQIKMKCRFFFSFSFFLGGEFLCTYLLLVLRPMLPQPPLFCIHTDESAQPAPVHFITSTPEHQPLQDPADNGPIRPLMRWCCSPSGLSPAAKIKKQKKNENEESATLRWSL